MLKLETEKLGKVRSASIELAPLVLLVGKNNTGKSYIATVIWAISNLSSLLDTEEAIARRPKWFRDFATTKITDKATRLEISSKQTKELVAFVNGELERGTSQFLSGIFAYSGFADTRIHISSNDYQALWVSVQGTESQFDKIRSVLTVSVGVNNSDSTLRLRGQASAKHLGSVLQNRIFNDLVGMALFGTLWARFRAPVYIPAARTGLMLALRSLVSQSFETDEDLPAQQLPNPLSHFLQRMTYPAALRPNDSPVSSWLNEKVLHGSIQSDNGAIPDFTYVPEETEMRVPLHAASSMITEMAPILLTLQSRAGPRHIIFEEPEAHLHLEAQREMARGIARLVAEGVYVTVTTHSDTFVQQINNLLRLHGHPRRDHLMETLRYDPADLIDPAGVKAYEFAPAPGGTVVKELELTPDGFIVPSLNETLLALARETVLLQEDFDD